MLGLYHFAKTITKQIQYLIKTAFDKVFYSWICRFGKTEKSRVYFKILENLAFLNFPILLGISSTSPFFVPWIFGSQWAPGVVFIQILSIDTLFTCLTVGIADNFLLSSGKANLIFRVHLILNPIYFLFLTRIPLFGYNYILISPLLKMFRSVADFFSHNYYVLNEMDRSWFVLINRIKNAVLATVVMVGVVLLFQKSFSSLFSDMGLLFSSIILGCFLQVKIPQFCKIFFLAGAGNFSKSLRLSTKRIKSSFHFH